MQWTTERFGTYIQFTTTTKNGETATVKRMAGLWVLDIGYKTRPIDQMDILKAAEAVILGK